MSPAQPQILYLKSDFPQGFRGLGDLEREISSNYWTVIEGVGFVVPSGSIAELVAEFGAIVEKLSDLHSSADPWGRKTCSDAHWRLQRDATILWSTADSEDRDESVTNESKITGGVTIAGK